MLAAFMISLPAYAETLLLTPDRDEYRAASFVELLIDPTGRMTFPQAEQAFRQGLFKPNDHERLSLGAVKGAVWLHLGFEIPEGSSGRSLVLELSRETVKFVDVYLPEPNGGWRREQAGYHQPPQSLDIFSRYPAVKIPPGLSGQSELFVRLESDFTLGMGITILSREAFHRQQLKDSYLFGLLFGVPLALSLFNLFIFLSLRDKAYLYYVVFVSCMAVYQAIIHGQFRLLGLFEPWLEDYIHGLLIGVALFCAGLFAKSFLLIKHYSPRLDKMVTGFMALAVIRFGLALTGWVHIGNTYSQFLGLLSPIVAITTGLVCWKRGFAPARFYVLAWSALSLCIVWHVFVSLSILPWMGVSSMMMVFGSALESVLLSFALADRIRVMRREREAAEQREHQYKTLSMIDGLTGLSNRRFLNQLLAEHIRRFKQTATPVSLLFMDIDDFKLFNDSYGHPEGDKVLIALAGVLTGLVRSNDTPCRYGGEEFIILMPGAGRAEAEQIAERIRLSFNKIEFEPAPGETVNVGLSIGAAQLRPGENGDELIQRADQALYQAKKSGKNRTVLAGEGSTAGLRPSILN